MGEKLKIEILLDGYLSEVLSDAQLKEFLELIDKENYFIKSVIDQRLQQSGFTRPDDPEKAERIYRKIVEKMIDIPLFAKEEETKVRSISKHRWKRWLVAAGVFGLVFSTIWLVLNHHRHQEKESSLASMETPFQDLAPGGDKAMLTLADGEQIVLDSAQGKIVQEGNLEVTNRSGRLDYQGQGNKVEYHTLSTPRGGKYKLVLPDGTEVWLNAESSITFPTVFMGAGRDVTITGEAYFEVAHNTRQPFQVKVNNLTVEVLGTHFNINSYADELSVKTTLLEGSVKLSKSDGETVILKPGQQAQAYQTPDKSISIGSPDTDQVMAWKNGRFYFNDADLKTIMREVMRWYNVEVEYSGNVPVRYFTTDISRDNNLSSILKVLALSNIHFKLEKEPSPEYAGKIIVLP